MKTPLFGACLLLAISSFGQKASEKASKEICECVHKIPSNIEEQHVKDSINSCFGQAMAAHHKDLNKEFKMKSTTVESVIETYKRLDFL